MAESLGTLKINPRGPLIKTEKETVPKHNCIHKCHLTPNPAFSTYNKKISINIVICLPHVILVEVALVSNAGWVGQNPPATNGSMIIHDKVQKLKTAEIYILEMLDGNQE